MAPLLPIHPRVELRLGGAWVDITDDVRTQDDIAITRGRSGWSDKVDPGECTMKINNRHGTYSPRNPRSPYYGVLGRNTPIRVGIVRSGETLWRFHGEVSSWPPRWDLSGTDAWVSIEAAGILRRMGQGNAALRSYWRREIDSRAELAYWPLEDGRDANQAASSSPNTHPASADNVNFARADTLPGSRPVAQITSDSDLLCPVPGGDSDTWQVVAFVHLPAGGIEGGANLLVVSTNGSVELWGIQLTASQNIRVIATGPDFEEILISTSYAPVGMLGAWVLLRLGLVQNGANVEWIAQWVGDTEFGGENSISNISGTVTGETVTRMNRIMVTGTIGGENFPAPDGMEIGHIRVAPNSDAVLPPGPFGAAGERAARRMQRLATEEEVPLEIRGDASLTHRMGPQQTETLLDLLQGCADVDGGILHESREKIGLVYRARHSIYDRGHDLT